MNTPEALQILSPSGARFGLLQMVRTWLFSDRIQAMVRQAGQPDRPFEALLPISPFHFKPILESAACRAAGSEGANTSWPRLNQPKSKAFIPVRRALNRYLVGPPQWWLGRLLSDPLQSGPASIDPFTSSILDELADPFPMELERTWILYEAIDDSRLGRIYAAPLDRNRVVDPASILIDLPFHLSWPFPLQWNGETYLLPETGSAQEVALWKCDQFPDRWTKCKVLLQGERFLDPTLFHHEGRWWLFVSVGGRHSHDHSAELRLYHSEDLFQAPFQPHPSNPISLSVEGSRPAGKLFQHQGEWFRPAQDCSGGYGRGIQVRRILQLDPARFREEVVSQILPPERSQGIHTLNRLGQDQWVVDYQVNGGISRKLRNFLPFG